MEAHVQEVIAHFLTIQSTIVSSLLFLCFRKDLVKQRLYFLFDLLSATTSYFIHGRALVLMILQNIQHAFYVFTWEERFTFKASDFEKIPKFEFFCIVEEVILIMATLSVWINWIIVLLSTCLNSWKPKFKFDLNQLQTLNLVS